MRTSGRSSRARQRNALVWQMIGATFGFVVVVVVGLFVTWSAHSWAWYVWFALSMYALPMTGLLAIRWYDRHTAIDQHQRLLIGVLELVLVAATIVIGLVALDGEETPGAAALYIGGLTLMTWANTYVADSGQAVKMVLRALRPAGQR